MQRKALEVEFNGVKYPVSFSPLVFEAFEEKYDLATGELKDIFTDPNKMRNKYTTDFIFFALRDGALKTGQEFSLSREDVAYMRGDDPGFQERIFSLFAGDDTSDKKKQEGSETSEEMPSDTD